MLLIAHAITRQVIACRGARGARGARGGKIKRWIKMELLQAFLQKHIKYAIIIITNISV